MSDQPNAFVAYPSQPGEISQSIDAALAKVHRIKPSLDLQSWETNDIPGRCLVDPILEKIGSTKFLVADITRLNFNVLYEIGYAVGKKKRAILIRNKSLISNERLVRDVGIFDTLGHHPYSNSDDLAGYLTSITDFSPLPFVDGAINKGSPIYIVSPRDKTESEIRLFSRVKKEARLFFRSFDPQEHGRLSVRDAVDNVASSLGVILPLISVNREDREVHNLRCAFVAGLAHALDKETLILQAGEDPVPLDLRDEVSVYFKPEGIDPYVAAFAPRITERLQQSDQLEFSQIDGPLRTLFLGATIAENEFLELSQYYIQTDEYHRVLRKEVQVVAGRKGSGKTALFSQIRNKLRSHQKNIVADLNPEGFQLRKFKTVVLNRLEEGTREHTITVFWEYLLLLELCYKLLEKDRQRHFHDHTIRELYRKIHDAYRNDPFVSEGDFAERLLRLIDGIEDEFQAKGFDSSGTTLLTRQQITEFIYKHDLKALKNHIIDYLRLKDDVWVLFDNLDKGWTAQGIDKSDLLILRCLIAALSKLKNDLKRAEVSFQGVVFVRNDVYEMLVESIPDRGKISKILLDWIDYELLKELMRRRFVKNISKKETDFETIWRNIAETHIFNGQESSQYILQRSLMRPRALLELLHHCHSHAINLSHAKITEDDFHQGEKAYSIDLLTQIGLEIQDVFPLAQDCLFAFIEAPRLLDKSQFAQCLRQTTVPESDWNALIELLLWYGFVGILRKTGDETYIYDVSYEMKKLKALITMRPENDLVYVINPAFCKGLDIAQS